MVVWRKAAADTATSRPRRHFRGVVWSESCSYWSDSVGPPSTLPVNSLILSQENLKWDGHTSSDFDDLSFDLPFSLAFNSLSLLLPLFSVESSSCFLTARRYNLNSFLASNSVNFETKYHRLLKKQFGQFNQ